MNRAIRRGVPNTRERQDNNSRRRLRRHDENQESHISFRGNDEESFDDYGEDEDQIVLDDDSEPSRSNRKPKNYDGNAKEM